MADPCGFSELPEIDPAFATATDHGTATRRSSGPTCVTRRPSRILSVLLATIVSFVIASLILKMDRKGTEDIGEASEKMESLKGKRSSVASHFASTTEVEKAEVVSYEHVKRIVFACDAGMGSSAMGASLLKNKLKKAERTDIDVKNIAISNLPTDAQIIFTHKDLTERAQEKQPDAIHVSVDNFLSSPRYDEVVERLNSQTEEGSS